ncbi:MAG: TetR/AcrR family transcriptional regulator [Oscillospiraceae bacterium]|nr:TetR/AcrR family transcriptional regulator [Oscillospiraceae bacterium]
MPKVKEGYFEDKKNSILDVAERLCLTKPLNKLTMADITKESGFSPGAIYASFSDIDEVIVALINRMSVTADFEGAVTEILGSESTPEEKIKNLFSLVFEMISSTVSVYGKIYNEYTLVAVDVERRKKLESGVTEKQAYSYVQTALMGLIDDNIATGYFKPRTSKGSVYALIIAFIDGIIRDLSLVECYDFGNVPYGVTFKESDLPEAITDSVVFLLNHDENQKGAS